ncbi:putative RNA-binding protein [Plasmodium gaboni]|uniref:Putative RNA-binding protein n=1 Tax=Plasmodium gaboni TaxID=647221 RepID=A0A151LL07_9APIC|nr:putative RNA-binding protein [Plasmodium gaboni]KYN99602.1 putative RNA-binding protein [Plasmodium gaboni]
MNTKHNNSAHFEKFPCTTNIPYSVQNNFNLEKDTLIKNFEDKNEHINKKSFNKNLGNLIYNISKLILHNSDNKNTDSNNINSQNSDTKHNITNNKSCNNNTTNHNTTNHSITNNNINPNDNQKNNHINNYNDNQKNNHINNYKDSQKNNHINNHNDNQKNNHINNYNDNQKNNHINNHNDNQINNHINNHNDNQINNHINNHNNKHNNKKNSKSNNKNNNKSNNKNNLNSNITCSEYNLLSTNKKNQDITQALEEHITSVTMNNIESNNFLVGDENNGFHQVLNNLDYNKKEKNKNFINNKCNSNIHMNNIENQLYNNVTNIIPTVSKNKYNLFTNNEDYHQENTKHNEILFSNSVNFCNMPNYEQEKKKKEIEGSENYKMNDVSKHTQINYMYRNIDYSKEKVEEESFEKNVANYEENVPEFMNEYKLYNEKVKHDNINNQIIKEIKKNKGNYNFKNIVITNIFLGNIPPNITEERLKNVLEIFGYIIHIEYKWSVDKWSYAFVYFIDEKCAVNAVNFLNQKKFFDNSPNHKLICFIVSKQIPHQNTMHYSKENFSLLKDGPPGANLFLYGIPLKWTELNLIQLVNKYGHVVGLRIPYISKENDKKQGNRGFGFVSYDNKKSAIEAFEELSKMYIHGKLLKVQLKNGEEHLLPAKLKNIYNTNKNKSKDVTNLKTAQSLVSTTDTLNTFNSLTSTEVKKKLKNNKCSNNNMKSSVFISNKNSNNNSTIYNNVNNSNTQHLSIPDTNSSKSLLENEYKNKFPLNNSNNCDSVPSIYSKMFTNYSDKYDLSVVTTEQNFPMYASKLPHNNGTNFCLSNELNTGGEICSYTLNENNSFEGKDTNKKNCGKLLKETDDINKNETFFLNKENRENKYSNNKDIKGEQIKTQNDMTLYNNMESNMMTYKNMEENMAPNKNMETTFSYFNICDNNNNNSKSNYSDSKKINPNNNSNSNGNSSSSSNNNNNNNFENRWDKNTWKKTSNIQSVEENNKHDNTFFNFIDKMDTTRCQGGNIRSNKYSNYNYIEEKNSEKNESSNLNNFKNQFGATPKNLFFFNNSNESEISNINMYNKFFVNENNLYSVDEKNERHNIPAEKNIELTINRIRNETPSSYNEKTKNISSFLNDIWYNNGNNNIIMYNKNSNLHDNNNNIVHNSNSMHYHINDIHSNMKRDNYANNNKWNNNIKGNNSYEYNYKKENNNNNNMFYCNINNNNNDHMSEIEFKQLNGIIEKKKEYLNAVSKEDQEDLDDKENKTTQYFKNMKILFTFLNIYAKQNSLDIDDFFNDEKNMDLFEMLINKKQFDKKDLEYVFNMLQLKNKEKEKMKKEILNHNEYFKENFNHDKVVYTRSNTNMLNMNYNCSNRYPQGNNINSNHNIAQRNENNYYVKNNDAPYDLDINNIIYTNNNFTNLDKYENSNFNMEIKKINDMNVYDNKFIPNVQNNVTKYM